MNYNASAWHNYKCVFYLYVYGLCRGAAVADANSRSDVNSSSAEYHSDGLYVISNCYKQL